MTHIIGSGPRKKRQHTARPLLAGLVALAHAHTALASLYSVQDKARPALAQGDPPRRLAWWEGGPAFALASSRLVRINFRGMYTYPLKTVIRPLKDMPAWHCAPCNVSAFALCGASAGDILPGYDNARFPERPDAIITDGWKDLACARSERKVLVSLGVYDITACDIFDEGLDVAYTNGQACHRHNPTELWEYWALVAISIVLVRHLSHNIRAIWSPHDADATPQLPALVGCLVAFILVLVHGDAHFLTSGDQIYHWAVVAYIAYYLWTHGRRLALRAHDSETPVYNIILATLQLIACRFYTSAETPYNLVLLGIIATRTWTKLLKLQARPDQTMLVDSLYLALSTELAYDGSKEPLVAVIGAAFLGGLLLVGAPDAQKTKQ